MTVVETRDHYGHQRQVTRVHQLRESERRKRTVIRTMASTGAIPKNSGFDKRLDEAGGRWSMSRGIRGSVGNSLGDVWRQCGLDDCCNFRL